MQDHVRSAQRTARDTFEGKRADVVAWSPIRTTLKEIPNDPHEHSSEKSRLCVAWALDRDFTSGRRRRFEPFAVGGLGVKQLREALRLDLSWVGHRVVALRDQTGVSGEYLEYLIDGCLLTGASRN